MQTLQWLRMRGHILPSTISTLSGSTSVYKPRKHSLENSCSTPFCPSYCAQFLSVALPGLNGFRGVLGHTSVISLKALTLKLSHSLPEAKAANGTYEIQIRFKRNQSDKESFAIYWAFTSQTLKVGSVMMLASDRGSVFTSYASCRENVCRAYEGRG